jgi:hypothetical protein
VKALAISPTFNGGEMSGFCMDGLGLGLPLARPALAALGTGLPYRQMEEVRALELFRTD